ncbi:hypothetical protein D3C76_1579680 [compost metagenome]
MGQRNPGDLTEGLGQHLGLVLVGGDGFRHHVDLHATERFGGFDEPLEFVHLLLRGQGRGLEFAVDPFLRRVLVLIGPGVALQP